MTGIQWTNATWNPVTGCTKVSPGCVNCYIEKTPPFRMKGIRFEHGRIPVTLHYDRLDQPLHWRKPRRVFVCSMSDLFHEDVPYSFLRHVFMNMALAEQHTFQLLTKRPASVSLFLASSKMLELADTLQKIWETSGKEWRWPLPNVWLGVTAENQKTADERIPILLETPAAKRFVSCEPLLGPLDLMTWLQICDECIGGTRSPVALDERGACRHCHGQERAGSGLDWVIVGGESGGPPERALVEKCPHKEDYGGEPVSICKCCCDDCVDTGWRPKPEALEWVRSIRDQCVAAGVPMFLKQWGGPRPKAGGRTLDGRTWDEFPEREAVPA